MKVTEIRSDKVYNKILNAKLDKKDDIYRYDLMNEFSHKWACYNIPIKATQKGGDGGIPGSIFLSLLPREDTINKIPSVLAHECNHNVRFQFIKWSNDITLEEMMINEGLAENFATWIYGEETLGPWVTTTDIETLNDYVKPIIKDNLNVQGLDCITAYLYGDDIATAQGYIPEGLPFCAGYACGYHMIKYYLKKTGKSIIEATLMPYEEIKKELSGFWGN